MKLAPQSTKRTATAAIASATAIAISLFFFSSNTREANATNAPKKEGEVSNPETAGAEAIVELTAGQFQSIKLEPITTYPFPVEIEAVGSIDFDEDLSVPVFSPYQGKIINAIGQLGDEVRKGEALFTIDSPDLIQAESTLISTAATLELTNKELSRARDLYSSKVGVSQRELEQATSDQQTAEGAFKAAEDAVRVFGKTEAEIAQIVTTRKIDSALVVPSPITGQVTFRNAQPGLFVQPGNAPAPYSVADVSLKWMLANVTESESPNIRTGQDVTVKVAAYPNRSFEGKISKVGAAIDPNTHRMMIRASIADPNNELRPGMLADFTIQLKAPVDAIALPINGAVREGDGTMTAWVTSDRHRFRQKKVKLGLQKDGRYQIFEGLERGELAVADGAVFLSNMLEAPPAD